MADPVTVYAKRVQAGKVLACKWHRLACVRHVEDLERSRRLDPEFPFTFDKAEAQKAIDFCESLTHFKGEWAGTALHLEPWERFIVGSLFGWQRRSDGLRRFRVGYVETPRGQGKSTLTAAIGLLLAFFDGEPAADVFSCATKRDQAKIVWEYARRMVMADPDLSARITPWKTALVRESDASRFVAIGADADTTDGLRPHGGLIDELHAHKSGDLVSVIETGMGTRRQPLLFEITTAGDDVQSICYQHHNYICQIVERIVDDETWFGFITTIDEDDDWQDERAWKKANPNWGVSVKADDLRRKCDAARAMPSEAANFQRKHLNVWVNTANPCLSMEGWRKGQTEWTADDMLHESCYVGIDLASKIDLCACSFVFPPTTGRASWRLLQYVWTPADTLLERGRRDRAPYDLWRDQGWLTATPGTQIDHQLIREVLRENRERFDIECIGFDPWHADTLISQLVNEDGFDETQVLAVPQTFAGMSSACLRLQAEVLSGQVDARRCPVTAWAAANLVDQRDGKGNMLYTKDPKKARGRIDPIVASVIGMSLAIRQPVAVASVYNERGVLSLDEFV